MLEHYIKAAKALDIDIDKIYSDMARALVREELTREERKKMRKDMKWDNVYTCGSSADYKAIWENKTPKLQWFCSLHAQQYGPAPQFKLKVAK